jgi:hypothetical protein
MYFVFNLSSTLNVLSIWRVSERLFKYLEKNGRRKIYVVPYVEHNVEKWKAEGIRKVDRILKAKIWLCIHKGC